MKTVVRTEGSTHRVAHGPKPNTEPSYLKKQHLSYYLPPHYYSKILNKHRLPWCLTSVFTLPEGMSIFFLPKYTVKIVNI